MRFWSATISGLTGSYLAVTLMYVAWRSLLGDPEKFHEDYEPTLGEHADPCVVP